MICIIQKMFALLNNNLNYLKNCVFKCFFKKYNKLLLKKTIFFTICNSWKVLVLKKKNLIKDIRDLFTHKKNLNYNAIKAIRNLFRLEIETKEINDIILRDITKVFKMEKKKIIYKPVRVSNFFGIKMILNMKVMVIEIRLYQLKNILVKLGHI